MTAVEPASTGTLVLVSGDSAAPDAITIAFRAGRTRANNAFLKVAGDGSGTLGISNAAPGAVHFIVDVNGYFE